MPNGNDTRRIYLDHSASTPTDPRVLAAILPYFREDYGNASSMHSYGRRAEGAVEEARERVAAVLRCQPREIIFTSGGSESDNLALQGAALAANWRPGSRLLTTAIEHEAVRETLEQISASGGHECVLLPLDGAGRLSPSNFAAACDERAALASVIYASNEVGSVQPIAAPWPAWHARAAASSIPTLCKQPGNSRWMFVR